MQTSLLTDGGCDFVCHEWNPEICCDEIGHNGCELYFEVDVDDCEDLSGEIDMKISVPNLKDARATVYYV